MLMLHMHVRFIRSVILCSSLANIATSAQAADWTEFRGGTGQGHAHESNLPTVWDESTNIAWKQPVPGLAWSSPVVVGDRVFVTTATTEQGEAPTGTEQPVQLGVLCLNAASGETIWTKNLFTQPGGVEMHKKNSHASPTPLVEGETLFVHFGPHGTAALTLDGEEIWKQKLEYLPTHGNGGSPASAGELLIYCCDGHDVQYVAALEKATGNIRWKTPRDTTPTKGFSFATPLVIEVNGVSQAVCPGSSAVFAYDPATGKEIWRVQYGDGYSVIPRPVYGHGLVFVCTGYNRPSLLAIDPTGSSDVTDTHVRWQTDEQVPHSASLLLVEDNLYFVADKGIARCVDAKTGNEHWTHRLGGNFSASPLFADGRIYFQDESGTATVIDPGKEYREIARNVLDPDERTFASYAVAHGAIFLRSERHLYRIEASSQAASR